MGCSPLSVTEETLTKYRSMGAACLQWHLRQRPLHLLVGVAADMEEAVVVTGVVAASGVVTAEVAWVASTAAAWAAEVSTADFAEEEEGVSRAAAAALEVAGSAGATVVMEAMATAVMVTAMTGTDSPEVFLPVH